MNRHKHLGLLVAPLALSLAGCGGSGNHVNSANSYTQTNLVANKAAYKPQIVEPDLVDVAGEHEPRSHGSPLNVRHDNWNLRLARRSDGYSFLATTLTMRPVLSSHWTVNRTLPCGSMN